MRFAFSDGEKLGVYDGKEAKTFGSGYIARYRETVLQSAKNKAWKNRTDMMLADDYYFDSPEENVVAAVHGVALTAEENKIVYAFSVNGSSGIYTKILDDEQKTEAHIVSSNDVRFNSVCYSAEGEMLAAVQSDPVTSEIAVFSKSGDYKCVTGGDSLDENPSFGPDGKTVYFNSYGVGRDANNNFVEYAPSEIYKLDLSTLDVEPVLSDPKYSYLKPLCDGKGNLYYIKKPGTEKTEGNPFLEILLIPVRIVQAIAGFISAFVMCFAKKPLVSGQSGRTAVNGSAAKNGAPDAKKIFVNNSLLNVDRQLKKNKKQENYGFIPPSWKVMKRSEGGEETEIASGAADFCLVEENGKTAVVYTNGRHIFSVCEGEKKQKLADVDFCLKVGSLSARAEKTEDLFGLL